MIRGDALLKPVLVALGPGLEEGVFERCCLVQTHLSMNRNSQKPGATSTCRIQAPALGAWGCCHKVPPAGGWEQQKLSISQFWRPKDQGVGRAGFSRGL